MPSSANDSVPAGTIYSFGGSTPPKGFLLCDGAAISRTAYATLFSVIGVAWGYGNNSTTFNLPDLRGYTLRGRDGGIGRDPDRASRTACNTGGNTGDNVGSVQGDAYYSHNHSSSVGNDSPDHGHTNVGNGNFVYSNHAVGGVGGNDGVHWAFDTNYSYPYTGGATARHSHSVTVNSNGGNESRMKNANVNYIIKY